MSEPLGTNDIEDVVSSVRRLVSPEARPRPASRDLGMDRLILTSSLRIVAEQQVSGPPVIKLETIAKKSRPVVRPAKSVSERGANTGDAGNEILAPEAGRRTSKGFWNGPAESLSEVALGAEEAEVVAGDGPESAAASRPKRRARGNAVGKAKPVASSAKAAGAKRKSAAIGKASAQPVPAAQGFADPMAEYFPELSDEGDALADIVAPVLTDRDGNPISLLAEDELIQLMRRVIREELQGVLGEKITRNVRKLVRAEINRALTTQTLE